MVHNKISKTIEIFFSPFLCTFPLCVATVPGEGFCRHTHKKVIIIYTIGDFSKISKVSPRMLRHYDKMGLLKPKYVEKDTRYRYYTEEEMYVISMIKKLRRYQFSLKEIKSIVENKSNYHTKEMMEMQLSRLLQSTSAYNTIISELKKEIRILNSTSPSSPSLYDYDIMIGNRREQLVICKRQKAGLDDLHSIITDLIHFIQTSNTIVPLGVYMVIFHDIYDKFEVFNPACSDMEVCIPVNAEIERGAYSSRKIEEGLYISTTHIGNYDSIGNGYVALLKWARENNYMIAGPPIERCYKDGLTNCSPSEYVTEISFPVTCFEQPY
ncbi:MerR family transcriptional regulator [Brevibacillus fluminis]|uniref:MerR family transcriptional regulator n=1 Tax=Brevibacillus fluminis TaxID=511487 RepID=UPI003F8BF52D